MCSCMLSKVVFTKLSVVALQCSLEHRHFFAGGIRFSAIDSACFSLCGPVDCYFCWRMRIRGWPVRCESSMFLIHDGALSGSYFPAACRVVCIALSTDALSVVLPSNVEHIAINADFRKTLSRGHAFVGVSAEGPWRTTLRQVNPALGTCHVPS